MEEANAELAKAQRRLVKGNERLQLFTRREVQVRAQFEQDAEVCAQEPAPDPTPPHVQEKELVGKWAVHKAIDDACQALDHDSTCAAALASCSSSVISSRFVKRLLQKSHRSSRSIRKCLWLPGNTFRFRNAACSSVSFMVLNSFFRCFQNSA